MITAESLRADTSNADLSDDQVKAILKQVTTRIGQLHGQYDADFTEATGITKPAGSGSSYEFWAKHMKELKAKVDDTTMGDEVATLKATVKELEDKIAAGKGDEALVAKLKADIAAGEKTIGEYKTQLEAATTKYDEAMAKNEGILRKAEFDTASSGLTFKEGISDTAQKLLLKNAQSELKEDGYELKFIDADGKMNPALFKNGVPVSDKLSDLLAEKLKGELGEARKATGTGVMESKAKPEVKENVLSLDTSQFKTQPEAMKEIHKQILALGHSVTSDEFKEIKNATWDAVVTPLELPLR